MAIVSDEQVIKVLRQYNPWWRNPLAIKEENKPQKRLAYYEALRMISHKTIRRFAVLSGEIHDHAAVGSGRNEAVVLFGGDAGQRLEPVGVVSGTVGDSPVLHGSGHRVGDGSVQLRTLVDGSAQRRIHVSGKIGLHYPVIKHQTAEIVRNSTHNKRSFSIFDAPGMPARTAENKKRRQGRYEHTLGDVLAFTVGILHHLSPFVNTLHKKSFLSLDRLTRPDKLNIIISEA